MIVSLSCRNNIAITSRQNSICFQLSIEDFKEMQQSSSQLVKARRKLEAGATLNWLHWVIISLSLLLTFAAWHYSKSEQDLRIHAQFDREADQVVELIQERIQKYEDALWSGVALIRTLGR